MGLKPKSPEAVQQTSVKYILRLPGPFLVMNGGVETNLKSDESNHYGNEINDLHVEYIIVE